MDLKRLEVQAYVDEHDIGAMRAGERVRFRVDAFRDRELTGTVRAIYPKAAAHQQRSELHRDRGLRESVGSHRAARDDRARHVHAGRYEEARR